MDYARKIRIQNLADNILEVIFLNSEMRDEINDIIYENVAEELKDLDYNQIYISNVEKAVVKILHSRITNK
jgi:aspartate/glutamate racemase